MDKTDYNLASYVNSAYLNEELLNSTTGVSSMNVKSPGPDIGSPVLGDLYGMDVGITNFTAEITSYFYAEEDGMYTLQFIGVNDSAALYFADGSAFICCTQYDVVSDPTYRKVSFKDWQYSYDNTQQYHQYLKAGYYYPLKVIWTNVVSDRILQFSITTPSGVEITDSSTNQFFSPAAVVNEASCSETIIYTDIVESTASWTGFFTSTTVTLDDAGTWTESDFYPEETVTSYVSWTGSNTVTSTTIILTD